MSPGGEAFRFRCLDTVAENALTDRSNDAMHEPELTRILEHALHAQIAARCHRAYRHDLRNGLQGIYGGFDALNRLLQSPKDAARVERTVDFVRQAITGHEKSLDRVLHALSPLEQAPEPTEVSVLLQELVKFLTNDAAANRVTLRNSTAHPVSARVRSNKLRLVLLSVMIDAIEAMPGGGVLQLISSTSNGAPLIEFTDTRADALPEDPWKLDLDTTPVYRGWTLYAVRQLIVAEAGRIDCEASPTGGRCVRIWLQAV